MSTLRSKHRFVVKGHNMAAAMIAAFGTLIVVGVTVLVLALTSGGTSSVAPSHPGSASPRHGTIPAQPSSTASVNVTRSIAQKYIATLDALKTYPTLYNMWARGGVAVDAAEGSTATSPTWQDVFDTGSHWRGSLIAAGPGWAAVAWVWSNADNPFTHKPFTTPGLSILEVKGGKITRETIYYNVPGRSPDGSPAIGRTYAAALNKLEPSTIKSLYAKDAVQVDIAKGQQIGNANDAIAATWQNVLHNGSPTRWQGTLSATAPSFPLDNGKTARGWVVVDWVWSQSSNPVTHKPFTTKGVSILEINNGKVTRETIYYNQPGR